MMEASKSILSLMTLLMALIGISSCASPTADTGPDAAEAANIANAITGQVNSYRSSIGVRDLRRHSGLDQLSRSHSRYLRSHRGQFSLQGTNVSHIGSDGRSTVAMRQYQFNSTSECVAAMPKSGSSQQTAANFLNAWKHSSQHHYAIRNKEWTHIGVGVAVDADGMTFATLLFATGGDFQMPARDRYTGF